jgi:uncharacterized protein (DUF2147 family)
LAVLWASTPATAAGNGSVEGRWKTDDGKAIVAIAPCGSRVCGKIDKVLDTAPNVPRTDINNPDPKLRSRTILGLPILQNYRSSGSKWVDGRAYDPKTGSSYKSSLAINPDGSLKVTGCVLFVCESKRWTRVS